MAVPHPIVDVLHFACPRCGASALDDYEVLEPLLSTAWRCEACDQLFDVLLLPCDRCGAEEVSTALIRAEQPDPSRLRCGCCGAPYVEEVCCD
jgi:transcription elongation factor Elf1